jgi:hypothetical protein
MKVYVGYFTGELDGGIQTDVLICSTNLQKTIIFIENNIEEFIRECGEKVNWFQIDIYRTEKKYLYTYMWKNYIWGIDEMEIEEA